jgi:hypothetical protein
MVWLTKRSIFALFILSLLLAGSTRFGQRLPPAPVIISFDSGSITSPGILNLIDTRTGISANVYGGGQFRASPDVCRAAIFPFYTGEPAGFTTWDFRTGSHQNIHLPGNFSFAVTSNNPILWSPDNRYLALSLDYGRGITILDTRQNTVQDIEVPPSGNVNFFWLPDSEHFLYKPEQGFVYLGSVHSDRLVDLRALAQDRCRGHPE